MIGPCGLLLVVPHLFAVAVPVSVLLVGLQKSTSLSNLDVKNIFAGLHNSAPAGDALRYPPNTHTYKRILFSKCFLCHVWLRTIDEPIIGDWKKQQSITIWQLVIVGLRPNENAH